LTRNAINALPRPTKGNQVLYPDPEQPGLAVRVTAGSRSFVVDRNTSRGRIRITLGAAGADSLTVAQAQAQARIALGLIAQGYTAAQIKERMARIEDRIPSGAMTLGAVLDQYLDERKHKLAERTASDYRKLLAAHFADWRDRPLETIDETAVVTRFTSITSPSRGNYAFRLLRALFRYARSIRDSEGKPIVEASPVDVLSQRRIWHKDKQRREVIELAALRPWWRAVKALKSEATNGNADTVRDWLLFLLLTGLRRNEAATLRWKDVDLRTRMFTVQITKNREPHSLPTSDFLQSMLARRDAAAMKEPKESHAREYVFSGERGPLAEPKKQIAKVVAASGVTFSAHTLRRTFATIAESRDIPFLALKRLLNHKATDVTGKSYTVIGTERLREPMQKITTFILRTVGERRSAKVVKFERKATTA
jgi:integrase